jgi:hypothetical protein
MDTIHDAAKLNIQHRTTFYVSAFLFQRWLSKLTLALAICHSIRFVLVLVLVLVLHFPRRAVLLVSGVIGSPESKIQNSPDPAPSHLPSAFAVGYFGRP